MDMTKLSIGQSTHPSQHFGLLMVVLKASSSEGVIIMSARREMWDSEGEPSPYQYNITWCRKYSTGTVFYLRNEVL